MAAKIRKTRRRSRSRPAGSTKPAHFRFFDNREKYLLFVTTTNEKAMVAERIGQELRHLHPEPPALRIFDAGMGDGMVLTRLMRRIHRRFPHVPWFVVGKEISIEDVRLSLDKLIDRFHEHPQMVTVITNMNYSEAPTLMPRNVAAASALNWIEVPLKGSSTEEFEEQIAKITPDLINGWDVTTSPKSGNPVYVRPSVLVLYREDQRFTLDRIIPRPGTLEGHYDLIVASQPYRARVPAATKVRNVIAPLSKALAHGGRMIVVQSYGDDPGMEIIHGVWPDEDPFKTHRNELLEVAKSTLNEQGVRGLRYLPGTDRSSLFRYALHTMSSEVRESIGTSTLLAAWNAATYVAQMEDVRVTEALNSTEYLDVTRAVLDRHEGLWFTDESFVVARPR
jgi:hypothetical protein